MRLVFILLLSFGFFSAYTQSKLEKHKITDGFIVEVYTPELYPSYLNLPVVYFNDGEYIFSYLGGFNLKPIADSLIETGFIDPMIIVAIHHDSDRKDRFIPYNDPWIRQTMGSYEPKGEMYIQELQKIVIPFVESQYKTDKDKRALFGFSFGGLNALWAGLNSNVFTMVAGLSPSLWVADYALIREGFIEKNRRLEKVWFDIGTAEWNYYVPFINTLSKTCLKLEDVYYYEIPDGRHSITDWRKRIGLPLHLFSSTFKPKVNNLSLVKECIQSQSDRSKIYQRLNAIVETESGLKYSLAEKADYEILKGLGKIESDGRFFVETGSIKVCASYKNLYQQITLRNCK